MAAPSSSFSRRTGQHAHDSGSGPYAFAMTSQSVQSFLWPSLADSPPSRYESSVSLPSNRPRSITRPKLRRLRRGPPTGHCRSGGLAQPCRRWRERHHRRLPVRRRPSGRCRLTASTRPSPLLRRRRENFARAPVRRSRVTRRLVGLRGLVLAVVAAAAAVLLRSSRHPGLERRWLGVAPLAGSTRSRPFTRTTPPSSALRVRRRL